jgi:hypothetical protein
VVCRPHWKQSCDPEDPVEETLLSLPRLANIPPPLELDLVVVDAEEGEGGEK